MKMRRPADGRAAFMQYGKKGFFVAVQAFSRCLYEIFKKIFRIGRKNNGKGEYLN